jgi:hypothetical protein
MAITFQEFEVWLSGGAGNTDGEAALGGARSTAKRVGRQTEEYVSGDQTGITITDIMWSGEGDASYADNERQLSVDDPTAPPAGTDADLYWNDANSDVLPGTTGTGVQTGLILANSPGYEFEYTEFTIDYDTIVQNNPNPPHSGTPVAYTAKATPNELWNGIDPNDYQPGITKYRCVYLKNNGAATMGAGWTLWLNNHGQPDKGLNIINPPGPDQWLYEVGVDPAGVNATATTIVDEETAPAGVTFFDAGSVGVALPTLAAGDEIAVWIKVIIPAGYSPLSDYILANPMPGWLQFYLANDTGANDQQFFMSFGFDITPAVAEEALTDGVEFADSAVAYSNFPEDGIAFSDVAEATQLRYADLTDGIDFSESTGTLLTMYESLEDGMGFTDAADARAILNAAIIDTIAFGVSTALIGDTYEGWALNLETDASSRYQWGPFTSFARFQGKHYGVSNEGVFLLEGDDDAGEPIQAFALLGVSDLEIEFKKRIKAAYLGIRSSGEMLLKVVVDEEVFIYTVITSQQNVIRRERAVIGLGLYGNYWQFGIENADGVDFELESVKILPLPPIVGGRRKD